jgi:hypothetical protein
VYKQLILRSSNNTFQLWSFYRLKEMIQLSEWQVGKDFEGDSCDPSEGTTTLTFP